MPVSLTIPMILPTTLALAAAAALINFWLSLRIGQLRGKLKVDVGDGGHDSIFRRMRAHANFSENTPLLLILVAGVELSGKGSWWLPVVGAVFMLGRVTHAWGMDGRFKAGRVFGAVSAILIQLGLGGFALFVAMHQMMHPA